MIVNPTKYFLLYTQLIHTSILEVTVPCREEGGQQILTERGGRGPRAISEQATATLLRKATAQNVMSSKICAMKNKMRKKWGKRGNFVQKTLITVKLVRVKRIKGNENSM